MAHEGLSVYDQRLLEAVDGACAASTDRSAYADEIAHAFHLGPISTLGMGQRLSALRTDGLVLCRPGTNDHLQWQRT